LEKATAKTKILATAAKIKFSIIFSLEFRLRKATTKTNILPKAGKIHFSIAF